jgi:cobaltochelatase CobT
MQPEYRVYTTEFDREIRASDIGSVLGPLSPSEQAALEEARQVLQMRLLPWKTNLEITASEGAARIRSALRDTERADAVVSILIDHSGSMRGQKILYTAATIEVVLGFLESLGIASEVLGFTTTQWRGGRSRRRWKWRFRPRANPGRLNDILHIVYQSPNDKNISAWHLGQMLRPDLLKENIDGEAILWAKQRLLALPQRRKHLIVLSDGAPVDDSTLQANGNDYLSDHLREVIEHLQKSGEVKLAAVVIGRETGPLYPVLDQIDAASDLGDALLSLIERVLTAKAA